MEDASQRLYEIFSGKTSPRSSKAVFTRYLGAVVDARESEGEAEGQEQGGDAGVLCLPTKPSGGLTLCPGEVWVLLPLPGCKAKVQPKAL